MEEVKGKNGNSIGTGGRFRPARELDEDAERIMAAVVLVTPLMMGKYDRNSYRTAVGVERCRPLEGAAAGILKKPHAELESALAHRP